MSERTEVTKVVENVDRLFSEIVVNGESHVSDRYVPPESVNAPVLSTNQSEDEEEQTAEQNNEPVQGEYVKAVELNNVLHDFNDEELAERVTEVQGDITRIDGDISDINNSITGIEADIESAEGDISDLNSDVNRIDTTIGTVQSDIGRLNNRVSDVEGSVTNLQSDVTNIDSDVGTLQIDVGGLQSELTTLNNLLGTIQSRVNEINTLIPNQASAQNQLADKGFVNSSIASNTANFMGTYTTLADIEAIPNPTNNDYAFLQTTDSAGNTLYKRYKYSADVTQWLYEYDLNNSSFTAEQWATINSGLTQSSVSQSILNAINALDVASAGGSGKYISEIQESNGKIQATEGTLSNCVCSGDTCPVTSDAVAQAITDLCASAIGGSGKYIATLQQTDGKVLATEGTFSNTVQSGDYAPVTSDAVAQAIASAGVSAVDAVVSGCMSPVTSNAVANWCPSYAVCAGQSYCVMDYCANTTPLYVGYAGAGLTCAQVTHLVAFSTNYISGKTIMKDASKATIQSWLGLGSASYCSTRAGGSVTYVPWSGTDGCPLLTGNFLAYWNGAYDSNGNSNLRYYCGGAFGSASAWNASTSATANTVVARDGNGYIYGTYFNSSIGDENINSYGGASLIFSGSDKWLRRTPPSCVCVGSAGYALSASYADSAGSAGYATSAGYASGACYAVCLYPTISNALCTYSSCLCNRCNFPVLAFSCCGCVKYLPASARIPVQCASNYYTTGMRVVL